MKLTIANLVSALSAISGVVGVFLMAFNLGDLTTPIRATIAAICGLLTALASHHAHSVTAARALAKQPSA